MSDRIVILFYSNNYAIWAKKVFERLGVVSELISVPRHLSSDCGYCLSVLRDNQAQCQEILESQAIEYDRFESF